MNAARPLNQRIAKSFCFRLLTDVLTRKSNAPRGGLILGQIPHCTELNASQMSGVCPGGGGWAVLELTGTLLSQTVWDRNPESRWSLSQPLAPESRNYRYYSSATPTNFFCRLHAQSVTQSNVFAGFKPIMWYIEMQHVRTLSCHDFFIARDVYSQRVFMRKACRAFVSKNLNLS